MKKFLVLYGGIVFICAIVLLARTFDSSLNGETTLGVFMIAVLAIGIPVGIILSKLNKSEETKEEKNGAKG